MDAVVTGSLLQSSGLVRVSVQLVEVPSGTVLWSHAAPGPVDDMFQIQDAVCSAVVEALALPLSSREQRLLRRDVPASSEAYAHYLRANRLSASSSQWHAAHARPISGRSKPIRSYAPAWARFGRCLRVDEQVRAGDRRRWSGAIRPRKRCSAHSASTRICRWRIISIRISKSRRAASLEAHGAAARTRSGMQQRSGAVCGARCTPADTSAFSMRRLPRTSGRRGSIPRFAPASPTRSS